MNLTNEELELIALYRQPTRLATIAELEKIPLDMTEEAMQDLLLDAIAHLHQMTDQAFLLLNLDEVEQELEGEDHGEVG